MSALQITASISDELRPSERTTFYKQFFFFWCRVITLFREIAVSYSPFMNHNKCSTKKKNPDLRIRWKKFNRQIYFKSAERIPLDVVLTYCTPPCNNKKKKKRWKKMKKMKKSIKRTFLFQPMQLSPCRTMREYRFYLYWK